MAWNANNNGNGIGSIRRGGFPTADLLLLFDGTILDVEGTKYFVDKKSSKNFLITDYDFPTDWTKGFPYKSAATISAPVGDAELIAADFNNFLYDSGGTPNQIPIVSLFQDIDYEHRFFWKHAAQVLDANGVEIYEPRVLVGAFYSTVQADNNLTKIQNYCNIPIEITTNVRWVDPVNGLDTNLGTKLSPWKSESKVEASATIGDTAYTITGETTEASYLYALKNIDYKALGFSVIKSSNATYLVRMEMEGSITGFILDGNSTSGNIRALSSEFIRCLVRNTVSFTMVAEINILNCVLDSSSFGRRLLPSGDLSIDTSYINAYFGDQSVGLTYTLTNNKVKVIVPDLTKWLDVVYASTINILGGTVEITNGTNFINTNFAYNEGSDLNIKKAKLTFNNLSTYPIRNSLNNGGFDIILINDSFIYNNSNNRLIYNQGISNFDIQRNYFKSTLNGEGVILNKVGSIHSDVIIKENTFDLTSTTTGYGIGVGNETIAVDTNNTIDIITIEENKVLCIRSVTPESVASPHGIFIGFQNLASTTKYNFVYGAGSSLVFKGDDTDYSLNVTSYNIVKNGIYGIVLSGATNTTFYNNTFINNTRSLLVYANIGTNGSTDITFKNNIVISNDSIIDADADSTTGHVFDYNIYYSPIAKPFILGASEYTFTEWQALGYDEHSVMLTSLTEVKALFTDYDNGDYSLKVGSTAIDFCPIIEGYETGLDASTDWGSDTETPTVVTKTNTGDCGAYVS